MHLNGNSKNGEKEVLGGGDWLFTLPVLCQVREPISQTTILKRKDRDLGGSEDLGNFLFQMTRTARHWRRELDSLLAHYGLTEARTRPLIYIDRLGNGIRQKDLAAELEIEGSSLVRLVDSLEKGGLIRRRVGKGDRRERYLYLTPSGHEMVTTVRQLTDKLHQHVLGTLSPSQEKSCLSAFSTLDEVLVDAANTIDPIPSRNSADAPERSLTD